MSTSESFDEPIIPLREDEHLELEEDDQKLSEMVALDVESDSNHRRVESQAREQEAKEDDAAIFDRKFMAFVDLCLLLVVLCGMYLSSNPSITAVPIVTLGACVTLPKFACAVNLVETAFNVGIFSVIMLLVHFVEDFTCGVVAPSLFIRMCRNDSNYFRAVAAWISFSCLHMQAAMLLGSYDPRMFCLFPALMACYYAVEGVQGSNRTKPATAFCCILILLQLLLLIVDVSVGGSLNVRGATIALLFMLCPLEWAYFNYAFARRFRPDSPLQMEQKLFITGGLIRTCASLWIFIVLVSADATP